MYRLTADELALWQHPYPQKCTISSDGFTLTERDIVSGGFHLDRRSVSGNSIELGSVIASELTLLLDNHDGRWNETRFEGASIYVQVSAGDGVNTSIVPIGYFVIDNAPRMTANVTLTALDRMMQFDREYKGDITFPTTPAQIVAACCSACDVPLAVEDWSDYTNHDVSVESVNLDGRTYREIMAFALEVMGVCGYIDHRGRLMCSWYKEPSDNFLSLTEANRTYSDIDDARIRVDAVQVGDKVYTDSEDEATYTLKVEGNPLITESNENTIGMSLANQLLGFTYWPASATMLPCPHVWPLDMLTFYKKGTAYPIIVSGLNYTLNGLTRVDSNGQTQTINGYASANPLTKAEMMIIKEVENKTTELGNKITQLSYVNDIASNALGFHTTIEIQEDGSVIEYTHDKASLEDSMIIYKKTADGFFLSRDGGQTYTSGYDSEGNAVLNILSVNGLQADWLVAGILKDRTGGENFYLDLDTGELKIGNGSLHYKIDPATGIGALSLGDESSAHVSIDNDSVDLMDGDNLIASFGISESQIPKVKVTEYMHYKDLWEVSVDSAGNLVKKWIGG